MRSLKYAIMSAFMGALGPFFNKQVTTDLSGFIPGLLELWSGSQIPIYAYFVACIALMLYFNTLSVKYKMLSYKFSGAFLGTSIIFILGFVFSAMLGEVTGEKSLTIEKMLGAGLMSIGVALISMQQAEDNLPAKNTSALAVVEEMSANKKTVESGIIKDLPIGSELGISQIIAEVKLIFPQEMTTNIEVVDVTSLAVVDTSIKKEVVAEP